MAKPIKYPKFGNRFTSCVNEAFGNKRVTQKEMGRFFKVSEITARQWCQGQALPSMPSSIRVAQKLKVNVEWLLTGRGEKHPNHTNNISTELARLIDNWNIMNDERKGILLATSEAIIRGLPENKKASGE